MKVLKTKIRFRAMQQGAESGIKIYYGQGCEFWSCKRGGDLADFDVLLAYFVPNIAWEKITLGVARWWEQELYRVLTKKEGISEKTFSGFCRCIEKRYKKKNVSGQDQMAQSLLTQIENTISEKMGFIRKTSAISGMNRWQLGSSLPA